MLQDCFLQGQIGRRSVVKSILGGVFGCVVTGAEAQDASVINEIIKELAPIHGQSQNSGYTPIERQTIIVQQATLYVDAGRKVDVELNFEFGSDRITPKASKQIRPIGFALASSELASFRYLVAGHTDAVGSPLYNLNLSQRRALAVCDHLTERYPIEPSRLIPAGFGSNRPKWPQAPTAGINRRVELLLIIP